MLLSGLTTNGGSLALLLVVTVITTAVLSHRVEITRSLDTSLLASPMPLADFQLRHARHNTAFGLPELSERWTLLYTGYLNCPDLCPTTLALLTQIHADLPSRHQAQLQLAFASIDHEQDSPQEIAQYSAQFSPLIVPLGGSRPQLHSLTRALGFINPPDARTVETDAPPRAVAHSSAIALVNPAAELHALFRYPHDRQQITQLLRQLLN